MHKTLLILVSIFILAACSAAKSLEERELATNRYQAGVLKRSCKEQEIANSLTHRADSLYIVATDFERSFRPEKAINALDHAIVIYSLALAQRDLDESKARHQKQVESLEMTKQQLEYSRRLLEELKGGTE